MRSCSSFDLVPRFNSILYWLAVACPAATTENSEEQVVTPDYYEDLPGRVHAVTASTTAGV